MPARRESASRPEGGSAAREAENELSQRKAVEGGGSRGNPGFPLAVAATAPFGADVLERLAARHEIAFLLTRPDRPRGRGRKPGPPPAKETAGRLGIPVRQPDRLTEEVELDAGTIAVAAYGVLIPTPLLDRALWLNVHPSLLPRWRGAAPVERAIMAGDAETGVTIHRTTPELDAGPIAAQRAFPIGPEDDAGAVYAKAAALAVELLDEVLPEPSFRPQPEEGATYAEKITAADRELDWSRPAEEIVRKVRALSPHIGARAELNGRQVIVWRVDAEGKPAEVQPAGRRRMSYEEFLRGLR
ncbi:MAG: methionyl-tRNA formyltransferase [Gaiellaceae bacterium]